MQRRQFLRAAGAGAGAVGAATAPATAQDEEEDDGAEEEEAAAGGGTATVVVGPDGDFVFDPDSLDVPPGTTVVFEWDSPNHNVNPQSQPEDANWEGHTEIVDDPNTYEYTFEVEGTYEYQCDPHAQSGMVGEITVDPEATLGGGEGQTGPTVPASAMSLAIGLVAALSSTIAFAFFFLKYGGQPEE